MKRGLVLSGGGARGAYQVGAWRALRKLHIKFDIVTGTSVGAINGVFIVQNQFYKCEKLWKNIDFNKIYNNDFYPEKEIDMKKLYKKYLETFIKEKGVDTTKLDQLFGNNINPKKFFKSPINYGIITYNLSTKKPNILKKQDLNKENLVNYVLASATCYPAFKVREIDNEKYVDGGYYDYMPINLAVELGAEEIVAIDLNAIGIRKKTQNKNIPVIKIAPRNKIVNFLIFNSNMSRETIKYGYNDTMKTYNALDGDKYTFKKDHLTKNYKKYSLLYCQKVSKNLPSNNSLVISLIRQAQGLNKYITSTAAKKDFNQVIEFAGRIFGLNESKIYNINQYNRILIKKIKSMNKAKSSNIKMQVKTKEKLTTVSSRNIIKYIYDNIDTKMTKEKKKTISQISCLFKYEFLSAIYIKTVRNSSLFYRLFRKEYHK